MPTLHHAVIKKKDQGREQKDGHERDCKHNRVVGLVVGLELVGGVGCDGVAAVRNVLVRGDTIEPGKRRKFHSVFVEETGTQVLTEPGIARVLDFDEYSGSLRGQHIDQVTTPVNIK